MAHRPRFSFHQSPLCAVPTSLVTRVSFLSHTRPLHRRSLYIYTSPSTPIHYVLCINTKSNCRERERERKEVKIHVFRVDMDTRNAGGGGSGGGCVSRYGGGGCVARYVGGGGGCGRYDISMVDRMMLKFRPIAPKPMASGSGSGDSTAENGGKSGRSKRRYVRVKSKKRKVSTSSFQASETASGGGDTVVTLSLMPETPDRKEESPAVIYSSEKASNQQTSRDGHVESVSDRSVVRKQTVSLSNQQTSGDGHVDTVTDRTVVRKQTVSFVTVECVTETLVEGGWIGWNDEQQVKNMESDTCPGFISDGGDRVLWTNKAYREMAGGEEVVVVLVRKEQPPVTYPAAFTCSVRVTCRSGMPSSTLTVPCDAWRIGGGGYAWRLDVKAALCLGR